MPANGCNEFLEPHGPPEPQDNSGDGPVQRNVRFPPIADIGSNHWGIRAVALIIDAGVLMVADYISVFSAIIIGLAVTDLVTSFHKLMRHRKRVRWDWLIFAVALLVLLNLVAVWWVTLLWYGGIKDMSIAAYLPDLAILLVLFLAAATILPDEVPADGLDLRAFYLSNASYFWTLWAILVALVIVVLGPRYLPNADWRTFLREEVPNFAFLLGAIILACTKRYRIHASFVLAMLGYTVWDYLPKGLA